MTMITIHLDTTTEDVHLEMIKDTPLTSNAVSQPELPVIEV